MRKEKEQKGFGSGYPSANKMNKLKTILKSFIQIKNPIPFILDIFHLMNNDYLLVFKNGMKIFVRHGNKGVVSDSEIIDEVIISDQYKIKENSVGYQNVVDIGGQIGTFVISFVHKYPKTKIVVYEPDASNFIQLKKNIAINKLGRRIKTEKIAVTDRKGVVKLFTNPVNVGGHSIFRTNNGQSNTVNTISLEDVMKTNRFKKIDLLKIDCEGGEYKILLGASKTTLQKVSNIIFELHETPETIKKYSAKALLKFLVTNGFEYKILKEIYYVDEGRFWIITARQKTNI